MNSVFNVFALGMIIYFLRNEQVECKSDLSGFEVQRPVDYNTVCGEPLVGEFPWLVNVYRKTRRRFAPKVLFQCYGNIIDKHTVLLPTCVESYQNTPNDYFIDVGKTINRGRTETTKEYSGQEIIIHPNFVFRNLNDDIAILKLTEPIEFSSDVHPICLRNDISKFNTTQPGIVPVWTYLNDDGTEGSFNTAYLPILSNNRDCRLSDDMFERFLNDRYFCAGSKTETHNLCRGSTGVSLMLTEATPTKFVWYLKGLLSFGKTTQENGFVCESGGLVFMDVFKYYNWILENKTP